MAGKEAEKNRPRRALDPDGDERVPWGRRTTFTLMAVLAAVVIAGLAVGYAVLRVPDQPATKPGAATSTSPTLSATSGSPKRDADMPLNDASMLTAAQAKLVAPTRSWRVRATQRGLDDGSPQPACLGRPAVEGRPPSTQTILRQLSSSGSRAPAIVHRAAAYASPEQAARAFAVAAQALGGCTMTGAYLQSGSAVSGLGDQALAVVVHVGTHRPASELRSVVLNRTGRVVNVVDVAQSDRAVSVGNVARALAAVTHAQCKTSGGGCGTSVSVKDSLPPPGGDQPGFLAPGDLPPVGASEATWAGTVPALPSPDFTGSGCETVNWAKVPAHQRTARTYLLANGDPRFGLDDIVVTQRRERAAKALVGQVKADLDSCAKRKLTATISRPAKVSGVGAGGAAVAGWTATVSQQTTAGIARYRVGIVSVRTKTVFTFLNPRQRLDLTADQWATVTLRAGQRASQVR